MLFSDRLRKKQKNHPTLVTVNVTIQVGTTDEDVILSP
jgi:hypothetical protein